MSEPIAAPVCTYALLAGGGACSFFGLDAEAMIFGFAGALFAQTFIPMKNDDGTSVKPWRAFIFLLAGGVVAAVFYPFAEGVVGSIASGVPKHAIKVAASFTLGIVAPLLPKYLRGKLGG